MEDARVCPICETSNAADALHCEVCGERLEAESFDSSVAEFASDGAVVGFAIEDSDAESTAQPHDPPTSEDFAPATVDVDVSDVLLVEPTAVEVPTLPPAPAETEESPLVGEIAEAEAHAARAAFEAEEPEVGDVEDASAADRAAADAALEAEFAALQAQFDAEEDPDVLYSPMDGAAYPRGSAEYEEGFGPNGEELVATPPAHIEIEEPTAAASFSEASAPSLAEPSGASMNDVALAAAAAPAKSPSAIDQFKAQPKERPVMQPLPTPGKYVDPATLTVYVNRQPVHRLPIETDEVLIGRRDPMADAYPDLDLTEFDPSAHISRKHAYIYRQNKNYTLYAISNAGTQVNADLLELGDRRQLHSGDVIVLAGKIAMKFEIPNH